jgi:hypothetical protein
MFHVKHFCKVFGVDKFADRPRGANFGRAREYPAADTRALQGDVLRIVATGAKRDRGPVNNLSIAPVSNLPARGY